ncbi:MAG: sulfite oxidase-like oxidoreductase [Chloroflexi bacterium]|nr:sulfite oxidase-like oxidoreductase [Chloroflexota bacterium]
MWLDRLHEGWSGKEPKNPNVPPGQRVTTKFPVLHVGSIPHFDPETWTLRVFGAVQKELVLSYEDFLALPRTKSRSDIHCVTGWSKLDNEWEGVSFRELMKIVTPSLEAKYVMQHAEGHYTTSAPLAALMETDVLLAFRLNGADLTPEHGWPLRVVVPKLYFWKSAKWLRSLELMTRDRLGFWEERGYNNEADPWQEQRYS